MSSTWEQPDWERDDLSKRASLDARLQDMALQHLGEDPLWPQTVRALAADLRDNDQIEDMLASFCVVTSNQAVYNHGGRAEAIAAFKQNLETLWRIARKAYE